MFPFKRKHQEVLNHWVGIAEDFQLSPKEFYTSLEEELKQRQLPGLEVSRVEIEEGGLLSDRRLYLSMRRERLVFDICAAPFGSGYFFSCRMVEFPPIVGIGHLLLLLLIGAVVFPLTMRVFGSILGILILVASLTLGIYLMRNAVAMGLKNLDKTLVDSPLIGDIYLAWFRKETYYREDTRLMYLETIPHLVKTLAEEVTSAKGVRLVRQYQRAPILGELYKPVNQSPVGFEVS